MLFKLLLAALLVSTDAAALKLKAPRKADRPLLALRGGGLDDGTVMLVQAVGLTAFGAEFGAAWFGSNHASLRYLNDANPSAAFQQLCEALSIALVMLATSAYDTAKNGDAVAKTKLGKILSFGYIGWSLMHVKWWKQGTLITTGKLLGKESLGQIGGGIPVFAIAALSIVQFLLK